MAETLGVNGRTVRRWVAGTEVPRPGVWAELIKLIRQRRSELGELLATVEAHVRATGEL
jgi:hypothetical protein